ncbi:hypothetical protein PIB30_001328 [Stylosanthes scabra]|uniref:Ubiquitin-like protease family profile domain-containing protein n=1 Tax=Stylosanthes scabra TaxID=79078 RepID=A0ABU6Y2W2_9FABA|nr:hypothetical protein [Stylosanthes scabra]
MTKKGKEIDKEKGRLRGRKAKQSHSESSQELPTIVEEDVSGLDNEILRFLADLKQQITRREETLMSMLSANASQTQTLAAIIAQQGRTIEALAKKVSELESAHKWDRKTEPLSLGKMQKESVLGKVKDFVKETCLDVSDTSTDLNAGIEGNSCKVCHKCISVCDIGHVIQSCTERLLTCVVGIFVPTFLRKLEFVSFSTHDIDMLYMIRQRHAGSPFAFLSHSRSEMTSEETPTCLDLSFRPPPGMRFSGTELAVAAYIFTNHGEERERLYDDPHCDGSRFRFLSLRPGCELYDDHMILNPDQYNQDTMDYIKDRYMGKADDLMMDKKLVYLDSFHSLDDEETQFRVAQIIAVGEYIEKMIRDRAFWESKDAFPPLVSTFEPDLPPTGQQEYGSMDCGVWVCEWMMNSHLWLDYRLELVTSRENPLSQVISDCAVNYWDAEMLRNHQRDRHSGSWSGGVVLEEDPPEAASPTI